MLFAVLQTSEKRRMSQSRVSRSIDTSESSGRLSRSCGSADMLDQRGSRPIAAIAEASRPSPTKLAGRSHSVLTDLFAGPFFCYWPRTSCAVAGATASGAKAACCRSGSMHLHVQSVLAGRRAPRPIVQMHTAAAQ